MAGASTSGPVVEHGTWVSAVPQVTMTLVLAGTLPASSAGTTASSVRVNVRLALRLWNTVAIDPGMPVVSAGWPARMLATPLVMAVWAVAAWAELSCPAEAAAVTAWSVLRNAGPQAEPVRLAETWHDPPMEIRCITRAGAVQDAGHLFDGPPLPAATERFLADERHHLLIAYVDDVPAGMVVGVEMTDPDKGTEMFLYELAVDEPFRGRGVGRALVSALADLARGRNCYGMWVITGEDNAAARATYRRAGGSPEEKQVVFVWTFDQA
ncbi:MULTISPECIES: GNAT family N-acetyltransferase [unclassified Kitasatospora]|uniref:GNAT family N-acetyltransferase n=1 Tax=unclassified Kitasatospora TaxID=2633591 RepID=UPI0032AFF3AC